MDFFKAMNHIDQSYMPIAGADHNVSTNESICTSLDRYAPLIDTIRGYFVLSLETRICDGIEMFFYNDEENLSTQFIPYLKKCLDVAGNALKNFFRHGIIPCILNTIVLNNRLNKVSHNLDQMGVDKNFLRHINVQSYIYANEYWLTYGKSYKNDYYINSDGSISFRSSDSTNNSSQVNHELRLANNNSHDKRLQMVVRNRNNHKIYHMIELPCNYQRFILHIVESIDSSWKIKGTDNLNEELIPSINDICLTINEKLEQVDNIIIKRCRLYCNIQNDCIYIKLKMMNVDGSKIFLYNDKICRENNSGQKSNAARSVKSTLNNPGLNIKSNTVVEGVSDEVGGGRRSSTSTRSSFRTINEYPHLEVNNPQNNNPVDNSPPPSDYNDNFSYESDHYERENVHTSNCSCTTDSHWWNYYESDCICNSSHNSSFHSAKNLLDNNSKRVYKNTTHTSPSISYKSFVNLSSSTPVNNVPQETPKADMIDDTKPSLSGQTLNKSGEVIQTNDSVSRDENVLKKSHISDVFNKILDVKLKRDSGDSKKSKSVSIQTKDLDESFNDQMELDSVVNSPSKSSSLEMPEIISIVISDVSQSQEVVGLERIDEIEEDDEIGIVEDDELIQMVEDIEEIQDYERAEEMNVAIVDEFRKIDNDGEGKETEVDAEHEEPDKSIQVKDDREYEEKKKIELMREARTQTSSEIVNESIILIRNEVSDFMEDLMTSFVKELDLTAYKSLPPALLESSKKNSPTKSEEVEIQVASLSSERTKEKRRVSTEEKFIFSPDSEQYWRSSSVFVSPCRHSRKSSASSPMIKCPRKFSASISDEYSYLESFSDIGALCGSSNFYATGDSSMNNLYTVYPYEWKSRMCQCKKYKKRRAKITERSTKKRFKDLSNRFKHYYPIIKTNAKLIMAALSRRLKIVFSKKTFYKLKYFIEERLIRTIVRRENAANISRICLCKMQHRRRTLNGNYSFDDLSMHTSNNSSTRYAKNYSIHHDKSKPHSPSSLSRSVQSPMKHLQNYDEVCTNRDSKLLNSYEHRRLSNLISDTKSQDVNDKLNNDGSHLCRCRCCCDSIQAINYYQSTDNSIYSSSNGRHRFSFDNKRSREKDSNESFEHKKSRYPHSSPSSLSLSSTENYFCYYHNIFAAKHFNQHSLIDPRYVHHRLIADELDVDCGECFSPADHNFRLMLNQYINLCKKIKCPRVDESSIHGNLSRKMSQHK